MKIIEYFFKLLASAIITIGYLIYNFSVLLTFNKKNILPYDYYLLDIKTIWNDNLKIE